MICGENISLDQFKQQDIYRYHRFLAAIPRKLIFDEHEWEWRSVVTKDYPFLGASSDNTVSPGAPFLLHTLVFCRADDRLSETTDEPSEVPN